MERPEQPRFTPSLETGAEGEYLGTGARTTVKPRPKAAAPAHEPTRRGKRCRVSRPWLGRVSDGNGEDGAATIGNQRACETGWSFGTVFLKGLPLAAYVPIQGSGLFGRENVVRTSVWSVFISPPYRPLRDACEARTGSPCRTSLVESGPGCNSKSAFAASFLAPGGSTPLGPGALAPARLPGSCRRANVACFSLVNQARTEVRGFGTSAATDRPQGQGR